MAFKALQDLALADLPRAASLFRSFVQKRPDAGLSRSFAQAPALGSLPTRRCGQLAGCPGWGRGCGEGHPGAAGILPAAWGWRGLLTGSVTRAKCEDTDPPGRKGLCLSGGLSTSKARRRGGQGLKEAFPRGGGPRGDQHTGSAPEPFVGWMDGTVTGSHRQVFRRRAEQGDRTCQMKNSLCLLNSGWKQ